MMSRKTILIATGVSFLAGAATIIGGIVRLAATSKSDSAWSHLEGDDDYLYARLDLDAAKDELAEAEKKERKAVEKLTAQQARGRAAKSLIALQAEAEAAKHVRIAAEQKLAEAEKRERTAIMKAAAEAAETEQSAAAEQTSADPVDENTEKAGVENES